eukprot:m.254774 g.254774  ORF g.254774 m.254774 type:complete len:357 (-) comp18658_c0_seq1:141-1211(-)
MSERRYLQRGAVNTSKAGSSEKLSPRSGDENNTQYGSSGRIRRASSRLLPGKTWFAGYNVQAQDDPLVETLPVGLRRRRLICVIVVVALCGLMSLAALIGSIFIMNLLEIDAKGMQSMVIEGNSVGFLRPFKADEVYIDGEGEAYIVRGSPDEPTIFSGDKVVLRSLSQLRASRSSLQLGNTHAVLESLGFSLSTNEADTEANFVAAAEQSRVTSEIFSVTGDLHVKPELVTTKLGGQALVPLEIDAQGTLDVNAFDVLTMESSAKHVNILAEGGDVSFINTNRIPSAVPFIKSSIQSNNDIMLDLSALRRPDAVSNAGQTSFTVCACDTDNSLYLVQGNVTCADTPLQYLSSPCQ